MIVSWNWLKDYVPLDMTPGELAHRLAMAGLNHESTEQVGDDLAIDLEVTSNRPDCLGHIGVAREIAVLFDKPLTVPQPALPETEPAVQQLTRVRIDCPDLCYQYTARIIRGVKIGPSPKWLADRLACVGLSVINNVVDVTNYVLMECGQPLHAFDLAKLAGPEIIVREAVPGEQFEAIDHRLYALEPGMCVIADAQRAVALGGVMGGAETEVSDETTDLLIESAEFAPLSIRTTARKLNLHSPSSYRFERGVDPVGVQWASRRCCQLILQLAGGQLAAGVVHVGRSIAPPEPIVLRLDQLPRILGIQIDAAEVRRILAALGCQVDEPRDGCVTSVPPSWRRDLTREIDLVEEVGRIHGYDAIPEDVGVPMAPSHRSDEDRVLERVRQVLVAAGFDEAMTCSLVPEPWSEAFSPWTDKPPLVSSTPMRGIFGDSGKGLGQVDRLRRSLVPSLLESRRLNQSLANRTIELFEIAKVYLPVGERLPDERLMVAVCSGGDFYRVKGVVETLLQSLNSSVQLQTVPLEQPLLDPVRACELRVGDRRLGVMGQLSDEGLDQFHLRHRTTVAELDVGLLVAIAQLIPKYEAQSPYPSIARDFNFVVDEPLRWADLASTVRTAAGPLLEELEYRETFRDPKRDGPGKKRLLLTVTLRAADRTLTSQEADEVSGRIVTACAEAHGARLLG